MKQKTTQHSKCRNYNEAKNHVAYYRHLKKTLRNEKLDNTQHAGS